MNYIEELITRYPQLSVCEDGIDRAVKALCEMAAHGSKVLLCGNGGSAADCEHIAGELLKGFLLPRTPTEDYAKGLQRGIGALPLPSFSAALSAVANDNDTADVYAQLTYALAQPGDVFWGLSTSGNAENVCRAARVAKAKGIPTIALVGKDGGKLATICDIAIIAPEQETYKIQELHLPIYHVICAQVEENLFSY